MASTGHAGVAENAPGWWPAAVGQAAWFAILCLCHLALHGRVSPSPAWGFALTILALALTVPVWLWLRRRHPGSSARHGHIHGFEMPSIIVPVTILPNLYAPDGPGLLPGLSVLVLATGAGALAGLFATVAAQRWWARLDPAIGGMVVGALAAFPVSVAGLALVRGLSGF